LSRTQSQRRSIEQLGGEVGKKLKSSFGKAPFDHEIPSLRIYKLTHAAQKPP
jgi:hypothetical protein